MIDARQFELDDLDLISPIESAVPHGISKGEYLLNGICWTIVDDGQVIACGGVMYTSPGVGTAWMHTDKCITQPRCRILGTFYRAYNTIINAHARLDLRRIQAVAFVDNPKDVRWLMRLGFASEGVMKYMGPNGEHAIMFAHYMEEDDA